LFASSAKAVIAGLSQSCKRAADGRVKNDYEARSFYRAELSGGLPVACRVVVAFGFHDVFCYVMGSTRAWFEGRVH
jgi:hypothetical protein